MKINRAKLIFKLLAMQLGYKEPNYGSCFGSHREKYLELYKWLEQSVDVSGGILEFGVASGGTTCLMGEYIKSQNLLKTIDSFDSFKGFNPKEFDSNFTKGYVTKLSEKNAFQTTEFNFDYVKRKLKAYGLSKSVSLHAGFFEDTLPRFLENNDQQYSFALIDCDLASSIEFCANTIFPYISQGGIIVFDDYASMEQNKTDTAYSPGVRLVVDEFVEKHTPLEHGYKNGLYHLVKPHN